MRKWHRWIALPSALLLLSVGITGIILQVQQFFGADEAQREKLASMTSAYSLDTPAADIAAKIDRARAAVQAKLSTAKLDAMEIQFKGDHPIVTFHAVANSARKLIVNADTGAIEKDEPDERESFILRLHTGEVFGDGGIVLGMVWGLALVALIVSGMWLYWRMYRARAGVKGWRAIFWSLLLMMMFLPGKAFAGSPFQTDDPGFAGKGWEIKLDSTYERNVNADILVAPILDLNYTIVEHFKLDLILAEKTVWPRGGSAGGGASRTGVADTDFRFKWRFLDEKPDSWIPALSMAPNVTFPTATNDVGGSGWALRLPFQIGKTFDKLYVYGELGYQWALSGQSTDHIIYGACAQYQLTDHWNVGIELYGADLFHVGGINGDATAVVNAGAVYTFNDHVQFQAAAGRTLRDKDRGGPEMLVRVLVQFNF